jgi:hypothetical protein
MVLETQLDSPEQAYISQVPMSEDRMQLLKDIVLGLGETDAAVGLMKRKETLALTDQMLLRQVEGDWAGLLSLTEVQKIIIFSNCSSNNSNNSNNNNNNNNNNATSSIA